MFFSLRNDIKKEVGSEQLHLHVGTRVLPHHKMSDKAACKRVGGGMSNYIGVCLASPPPNRARGPRLITVISSGGAPLLAPQTTLAKIILKQRMYVMNLSKNNRSLKTT